MFGIVQHFRTMLWAELINKGTGEIRDPRNRHSGADGKAAGVWDFYEGQLTLG